MNGRGRLFLDGVEIGCEITNLKFDLPPAPKYEDLIDNPKLFGTQVDHFLDAMVYMVEALNSAAASMHTKPIDEEIKLLTYNPTKEKS